ncbi:hypothetical protein HGI47_19180 [Novosphingobium sp. ERN07]|uniref:RNA polymerase sigma factor n=1 Tax=Novosphingobium sp. ERN07 TaxID=2726187 RepID=UPI001457124B|nr:sigma factor-like helix-turn-helix DNA-binding protein [Novosphingobium sp. ERN07]NLR73001.1 hypothetical protein [Novosphingobium sp. ERN07]
MSPSQRHLLCRLPPLPRWITRRRLKAMQSAIDALPAFHQLVFHLMRFENLSISEAAEQLQCEPATVEAAFAEVLIALVRAADPSQ